MASGRFYTLFVAPTGGFRYRFGVKNTVYEGKNPFPEGIRLSFSFGVTILVSACLLFLIQPLVSKLILPWFGGSAAVWITCMLFFQAGLLLGYLYAHILSRHFPPRQQAFIHLGLVAIGLFSLHVVPNPSWQPVPGEDPTWKLLGVLSATVGTPYTVLSSTSPLLQSWFARSSGGTLPYRYFALSNAGSLVALISYPILVEPYMSGRQQAFFWSLGFALFAVLCSIPAFFVTRSPADPVPSETRFNQAQRSHVVLWLSLSACTSALLLVVTNLLTQNIAPMPLIWVLPLSVYLLTFIFCFESERWYRPKLILPLVLPALAALMAIGGPFNGENLELEVPILLVSLFVCSMACHGELARMRPAADRLTTFYLCISAGGVVGGIFVALIAPHSFPAHYENPIVLLWCAALLLWALWQQQAQSNEMLGFVAWLSAASASVLLAVYMIHYSWQNAKSAVLLARNFYGALRVDDRVDRGRKLRELHHGTITHGLQFLQRNLRHQATTYYSRGSGIGLTWRVLEPSGPIHMGIVGLGAGTLATYGRSGDNLRFYEINPLIQKIAHEQFTFLQDCAAHTDVVLGDARLAMLHESPQQFDVLVIDAFSGDAIPVHLLTREAFQLYWRHLKPDGVLAVHISNKYLDLAPVVKMAAQRLEKPAWRVDNSDNDMSLVYGATYMLMSSRPHFFEDPLFKGKLTPVQVPAHLREWTDDYSNLWEILSIRPQVSY